MKKLALLALIASLSVMAQPRPKGAAGLTQLTGDVTAGPGSGSQATTLANIPATVTATSTTGTKITSSVANSGTNTAFTLDTSGGISGSTNMLVLKNGGSAKVTIDQTGQITTSGNAAIQSGTGTVTACSVCNNPITLTGSATGNPVTISTPNGTTGINIIPAGTGAGATIQNNGDPVPAVHHTQTTSQVSMEFGSAAGTAGALSVSFATSFSVAPICTALVENATGIGCSITSKSGGAAAFACVSSGSDVIDWICIGAR